MKFIKRNPTKDDVIKQTKYETTQLNLISLAKSRSTQQELNIRDENCADLLLKMKESDGLLMRGYSEACQKLIECENRQMTCLEGLKFRTRVMFMRKDEIERCADVCDSFQD